MSDVLIEYPTPDVGVVRLNRPDKRNALSITMRQALVDALERLDGEDAVRAIVLLGSDKIFAAGSDLNEMKTADTTDMVIRAGNRFWAHIRKLKKPIIAGVRGYAFGGGFELALQSDLIIAADTAKFALPEVKLGMMPGAGGSQRLLRIVGKHRALMLMLTGDPISAAEALSLGVLNRVVPDAEVESSAIELAQKIAKMAPLAIQQIREAVSLGADCPLDVALALEHKSWQILCNSQDKNEGVAAFFEKREPVFKGR